MPDKPDPILAAARQILGMCRTDMRTSIEGLPPEAINWKPPAKDTNSIAVMTHHSLLSTRQWLSVAVGEPLGDRDREAEFRIEYRDANSLLAALDEFTDQCAAYISDRRDVDWSTARDHWNPDLDLKVSSAWAIMHALEHLREHVGEIALTRHLWDAR